jgi:hypothetical protein
MESISPQQMHEQKQDKLAPQYVGEYFTILELQLW